MNKKILALSFGALSLCAPLQGMHFVRGAFRRMAMQAKLGSKVDTCSKMASGAAVSILLGQVATVIGDHRNNVRYIKNCQKVGPEVQNYCREVLVNQFGMSEQKFNKLEVVQGPETLVFGGSHLQVNENEVIANLQERENLLSCNKETPEVDKRLALFRGQLAHEYGHYVHKDGQVSPFVGMALPAAIYSTIASGTKKVVSKIAPTLSKSMFITCARGLARVPLAWCAVKAGEKAYIGYTKYIEWRADKFSTKVADAQALEAAAQIFKERDTGDIDVLTQSGCLSSEEDVERYSSDTLFREHKYFKLGNNMIIVQRFVSDVHPSNGTRYKLFKKAAKEKRKAELKADETNEIS